MPQYAVPGYKVVPLLQALNGYQLEQDDDEVAETGEGSEGVEREEEGEESKKQQNSVSESDNATLQL